MKTLFGVVLLTPTILFQAFTIIIIIILVSIDIFIFILYRTRVQTSSAELGE